MRYFLVNIIVFLLFSNTVFANMEDPSTEVNAKNNILIDKQIIKEKLRLVNMS